MDDDWDLNAVVRGCCAASSASSAATSTVSSAAVNANNKNAASVFPDLDHSISHFSYMNSIKEETLNIPPFVSNPFQDLHDELYNSFFTPKSPPLPPLSSSSFSSQSSTISPSLSSLSLSKDDQTQTQSQAVSFTAAAPRSNTASSVNNSHQPPRSKKRKNQHKRVCHVPADSLSSDIWAWRKYGQKPIKGSPYPRGYYRCSSSKGCLARKQVERNRSDPTMFIVTYTAEHNHPAPTHRNSLAGSTRLKPDQQDKKQQVVSPPANPAPSCSSQSTKTTESVEEDLLGDEQDGPGFSDDMAVNDDFFAGLEDFAAPAAGDCFADRFPANFEVNWAVNSAATAAGGI